MKTILQKTFAAALATAALTVGVSTIAMAETPSWCGPKKASNALLDGSGGNSWRQVTTASAKQTVSLCPSITKYEYADGNGDLNKSISDIKGMAAKGIDALVVFGVVKRLTGFGWSAMNARSSSGKAFISPMNRI